MSDCGREVFQSIIDNSIRNQQPEITISEAEYEQWKRQYTIDGLRGLRYGQSFCNHFGITNNLLYYCLNVSEADTYIKGHYIERS